MATTATAAAAAAGGGRAPNKPKHTRNSTWGGAAVPFYPTTTTNTNTSSNNNNNNHCHYHYQQQHGKRSTLQNYQSNTNTNTNTKQQQRAGSATGNGTHKVASSAGIMLSNSSSATTHENHNHYYNHNNNKQQQLGFAMERFLTTRQSSGADHAGDDAAALQLHHHHHDAADNNPAKQSSLQSSNNHNHNDNDKGAPLSPGGMIVNSSNMGVSSRSIEFEAMSSSDDGGSDVSELLASEMVLRDDIIDDNELDHNDGGATALEHNHVAATATAAAAGRIGESSGVVPSASIGAAGMDAYSTETWNMENVGASRRARAGSRDSRQRQRQHHHSSNYQSLSSGSGSGLNINVMNQRSMQQHHDQQQEENYQFDPPNMMIEGFDYDKNRPSVDSSYQHGSEFMTYSVKTHSYEDVEYADRFSSNYGSTEPREKGIDDNTESLPFVSKGDKVYESERRNQSSRNRRSSIDDVFSSVRSVSTADIEADMNESEHYLMSNFLQRAFPERLVALFITLIIEIPVLFMITGGSDRLCKLIGRHRYQLLMAFLPLASAISGNCGLQGSSLTTRAISHSHVTKKTYMKWLRTEVEAAFCLGLVMGVVIGFGAYIASDFDVEFGVTIGIGQFVSILTAGFTGTVAPLLFSFIFHRDSGKWSGPLETAIQDIMGSFAMVILSYYLILWLGPREVESWDTCGVDGQ